MTRETPNPDRVHQPRISVCMATYNGERFVEQQLKSILHQLGPNDEVLISDDGSTDATLQVIASLGDRRISVVELSILRSPVYNFERTLRHATGEFIFLADQDDEWVDGWVEAALTELGHVGLVVSDYRLIDAEGHDLTTPLRRPQRTPGWFRNLCRNRYMGCCCAFRREVLQVALPFPINLPWHDWWIGLVADAFFTTRFIDRKFIRYRRHESNASPTSQKSTSTLAKKIGMRWRIGTALAIRTLARIRNRVFRSR